MNQDSLSLEEIISEYTTVFFNKEISYNVISNWITNLLSKDIAYKIIDFINQFEDKLVKIWNKPKFILNSNYVITFDKIPDINIIHKIINHSNIELQIKEWQDLGIVDNMFIIDDVIIDGMLTNEYKHLPIDTKYFKDLEYEILSLFDDLDGSLDGWLIKSENWQALNMLRKYIKGIPKAIEIARDNGRLDSPLRIRGV